jgi:hypothetical protein
MKPRLDTSELARLVGTTPRHLARLTLEGVLKRARTTKGKEIRGRYPLEAVTAFCDYLRNRAKIAGASQGKWEELRNAKMAGENEIVQLRLSQMKGRLHDARDVEYVMTNMLTRFKARILAIPTRVARQCQGKKFKEIVVIIRKELELALRELADYDARLFEGREQYLRDQPADTAAFNGDGQDASTED